MTSTILQVNKQAYTYVDKALVSTARNYAIMNISREGPYDNCRSGVQIINLSDIQDLDVLSITPVPIPNGINGMIEHPLGIIGEDRLVFMNRNFWMCSWDIGSGQGKAQRHFSLPRNWVTTDILCVVTGDGIVLVLWRGEVAVIQSSLYSKPR